MKPSWLVPMLLAAPAVILDASSRVGANFEFRHHFVSLELPSNRGQGDYGLTALADLDRDGDLDFICGGRIPRPELLNSSTGSRTGTARGSIGSRMRTCRWAGQGPTTSA
jgi:hypothetical protein